MKNFVLVAAVALSLIPASGGVLAKSIANPPSAAQLDSFYAACVKVAPAATVLCKCKQEAAPKLIDSAFMDVVIASMQGKALEQKYYDTYNDYIARSNQICKPDY